MSQPVDQSGPVETMMASDAASRMLGIELLGYGDSGMMGWDTNDAPGAPSTPAP